MAFEDLLIHTVVVYNPSAGAADRYNNPTVTLGSGTSVAARVEQLAADEDLRERDTRVTKYRMFAGPDVAISALSVVEYDGIQHRVLGEPAVLDDGDGPHHIEAVLERIEG